ncbi:AhpC/TSA family protein [Ktedonosporobacter rubrisoli]|uniref:thioredoxin-dependent peroxiredoxin n=2 Tax=Ktedonosporobacter rubrisoli TaxID=2509675 RepID=A0A4P6K5T3_KTERU|nr:AhpC/TSA family protein [Ktedonosporobacter rubrisoli]
MATDAPLSQKLAQVLAMGKQMVPAELLQQLLSPVEMLRANKAAERALQEGEKVPDFTLPDALGNSVTLTQLLGQGPVVITFYRGSWCPYCNIQLHAYQQVLPQLKELGASLVAISPQTPDQSLSLAEKQALTFAVLSDAGNRVARKFGLVFTIDEAVRAAYRQINADLSAFNGDGSWELPMAGTFLVDRDGTIRLAFVDPDYTRRLEPSIIIASLKKLRNAQSS